MGASVLLVDVPTAVAKLSGPQHLCFHTSL
jgi:hypothetical protein